MKKKQPSPSVSPTPERAYRRVELELLLKLGDENGVTAFYDWWDKEGEIRFQEWINQQPLYSS